MFAVSGVFVKAYFTSSETGLTHISNTYSKGDIGFLRDTGSRRGPSAVRVVCGEMFYGHVASDDAVTTCFACMLAEPRR